MYAKNSISCKNIPPGCIFSLFGKYSISQFFSDRNIFLLIQKERLSHSLYESPFFFLLLYIRAAEDAKAPDVQRLCEFDRFCLLSFIRYTAEKAKRMHLYAHIFRNEDIGAAEHTKHAKMRAVFKFCIPKIRCHTAEYRAYLPQAFSFLIYGKQIVLVSFSPKQSDAPFSCLKRMDSLSLQKDAEYPYMAIKLLYGYPRRFHSVSLSGLNSEGQFSFGIILINFFEGYVFYFRIYHDGIVCAFGTNIFNADVM